MSTHRMVLGGTSASANAQRFARSRNFASSLWLEALEQRHLLTATVVEVTTTQDVIDPNDGLVSLREAVLEANASPNDYQIVLPAGTYTLTIQGAGEDAALTGDLDILNNGSMQIVGAGAGSTTIDGSGLFDPTLGHGDHIVDVRAGASLDLIGVMLTGAQTTPSDAGAICSFAGSQVNLIASSVSGNSGVGILNYGQLTITASTIANNTGCGIINSGTYNQPNGRLNVIASTISGDSGNDGGGIYNSGGDLTVTSSSITGNSATRYGGGIYSTGHTSIVNSTLAHNTADRGGGMYCFNASFDVDTIADNSATLGGGIYDIEDLNINNCTILDNSAENGGGIYGSTDLKISESTISNNSAGNGGGIYGSSNLNATGTLFSGNTATASGGAMNLTGVQATLTDCTLSHNSAQDGGAIYSQSFWLTLSNDRLLENTASVRGGGIAAKSSMTINDTELRDNSAGAEGGGIYDSGSLHCTGSAFSGNSASDGGAVYSLIDLQATVANSTLSDNRATHDGGGIYSAGGLVVTSSTLTANHADNSGGGVAFAGTQQMWFINSTVSGNSAGAYGGGVYVAHVDGISYTHVDISFSTITLNRAGTGGTDGRGGGLYLSDRSSTLLQDSIVAGNLREQSQIEVASDIELGQNPRPIDASFNLIGDPNTAGGLVNGASGNIVGDGNGHALNINAILDTTLADNGGPTFTHKLLDCSPAIDAGDPSFDPHRFYPATNVQTDQRQDGFPRVKNGRLDIGAYEADANPIGPGNVITVGTFDDSLAVDGVWSLREAVMYANSHPGDFTIQLPAGTYTLTRKGAGEDAAVTGDLDILNNGNIQIVGAALVRPRSMPRDSVTGSLTCCPARRSICRA